MSALSRKVADLTGVAEERIERISGGQLSEILLVRRPDGRELVAKGGPAVETEAAMLRALHGAAVPSPIVEAEHEGMLLLEFVPNDGIFSPAAWRDIADHLRRLHARIGDSYGWPVNYRLGTVELDNRETDDWPRFWGEQRLASTASLLDRPWRDRVDRLVRRLPDMLPASPPAAHLHGDLWGGNILVAGGALAAFVDPACYHGDAEVDMAMISLFDDPPADFWNAYGDLRPGWAERRPLYQLFPALVHLRLFGAPYVAMTERILRSLGF